MKFSSDRSGLHNLNINDIDPSSASASTSASSTSLQQDTITLPQLKYGYRQTPMTWKELQNIILDEKDLAKLSRSEAQQREYETFRFHLKRQCKSVLDFVLCTKFVDGFDTILVDGLNQAQPQLADVTNEDMDMVLAPNDFPYFMVNGIFHYILWKTKQDITQEDIEEARQELCRQMDLEDTLHWVNPPHLKSLPEIDHVHFLCLLRQRNEGIL